MALAGALGLQAINSIAASLNALTIKLEPFSGEQDSTLRIDEFIDHLEKYLTTTGKISQERVVVNGEEMDNPHIGETEKEVLRMHLEGPAKQWFRQLPRDESYEGCLESLKARFMMTDQQRHTKKLSIFKMTQLPSETFLTFVSRVIDKSRGLGIEERDIVTICMGGASPTIRPFLLMNQPTTLRDMMALPLARDEGQAARFREHEFVGLANIVAELRDFTAVAAGEPVSSAPASPTGTMPGAQSPGPPRHGEDSSDSDVDDEDF